MRGVTLGREFGMSKSMEIQKAKGKGWCSRMLKETVWEVFVDSQCHVRLAHKSGFCMEVAFNPLEILDMDVDSFRI